MKYRRRSVFIVSLAAVVMLFTLWMSLSHRERVSLEPEAEAATKPQTTTTSASPSKDLRQRLSWEEQRLARLQKTLATIQDRQTSATEAASQVADLQTQLSNVREQITASKARSAQVSRDAGTYQRQRQIDSNNEQIYLQNQMQSLDDSIYDLQIQMQDVQMNGFAPNPVLLGALKSRLVQLQQQRSQLQSSSKVAGLSARNDSLQATQEAGDAQLDVRSEQQALLRQQSDLAAALDYWQKQQKALDNPAREKRIKALRQQVKTQLQQVAALQNRIY